MSKILIKLLIILSPTMLFAQNKVHIKLLSKNINTEGSEFNFIQINKEQAVYTSFRKSSEELYESSIYETKRTPLKWTKGKYSKKYNLDSFNTGNIVFSPDFTTTYLTICDKDRSCKIAATESILEPSSLIKNINSVYNTTQPFVAQFKGQKIMYFVSDRPGGFGGMDIWLSIIDKNGNFGSPINLGKKINTNSNEITPFYHTKKRILYFSSDRNNGEGGFDIYKVIGEGINWETTENMKELNSIKDEMYLNFYSEKKGYFSSNRNSSCDKEQTFCCNDIFSFEYLLDEKENKKIKNILEKLPLTLYFDNDEPDCCTMDTTTTKTYKEAYVSYFKKQEEYMYIDSTFEKNKFFEDELKGNFNKLDSIIYLIHKELLRGKKLEIEIKGFSSPLFDKEYNINLSKRRIHSMINYFKSFPEYMFKEFIKTGELKIIRSSFGEKKSLKTVNDNPNEKQKSIYGIRAMLERKIEIINITPQK